MNKFVRANKILEIMELEMKMEMEMDLLNARLLALTSILKPKIFNCLNKKKY